MNAAVPVTGMVFLEDLPDRGLNLRLRVRVLETGLMVEESRAGQARDVQ